MQQRLEAAKAEYSRGKVGDSSLHYRAVDDMLKLQKQQTRLEQQEDRAGAFFGLSAVDTIRKLFNMACETDAISMDRLMKVNWRVTYIVVCRIALRVCELVT